MLISGATSVESIIMISCGISPSFNLDLSIFILTDGERDSFDALFFSGGLSPSNDFDCFLKSFFGSDFTFLILFGETSCTKCLFSTSGESKVSIGAFSSANDKDFDLIGSACGLSMKGTNSGTLRLSNSRVGFTGTSSKGKSATGSTKSSNPVSMIFGLDIRVAEFLLTSENFDSILSKIRFVFSGILGFSNVLGFSGIGGFSGLISNVADNSSTTRFGERSHSLTIICSILLTWPPIVFSSACSPGISGNGIFSILSCFSKLSSGAFRLSFSIFALRSKFCFISMLTISAKFRAAFTASAAFAILVGLLDAPSRDFFFCITETIVTLGSVGDFLGERLKILFGLSEGLNIDFGLAVVTVPLFGLSGDSLLLAFSIEGSLVRSKYGRSVTIFSGNFGKSLARLLTFLEVLLLSDSDFSSDAVPFITCLLCNVYGISALFFCIAALSENGSSSPESAGVKSMDFWCISICLLLLLDPNLCRAGFGSLFVRSTGTCPGNAVSSKPSTTPPTTFGSYSANTVFDFKFSISCGTPITVSVRDSMDSLACRSRSRLSSSFRAFSKLLQSSRSRGFSSGLLFSGLLLVFF
ncbi:hypothetical protein ALC57_03839 [Trachymyrmex cornetzi]|uniref:Uncharacterized protein n=1 Tax=Trachymyrmex cornetzi TaxID=471704 RepID=A0A195EEY2_9HYME|nr:hypothetical protein ALC57_03839 [Trachymyrmex cornetzi]